MIFLINNNGMRRLVRRLDYMRDNPDAIRRINFDKPIPRLKRGVLKWPVQSFTPPPYCSYYFLFGLNLGT